MKRIGKWALKVVSLALVITLAVAVWPYVSGIVNSLLFSLDYTLSAQTISHQMREVGKLTAVEYSDEGVLTNTTDAFLIGTVQKAAIPYRYDIALGVDLNQAVIQTGDNKLTVYLPKAELILDKLTVTGDAQIEDFWNLMTKQRYQAILDAHSAECQKSYLENPDIMDSAWKSACKVMRTLIGDWVKNGDQMAIEFKHMDELEAGVPSASNFNSQRATVKNC